jgi:hypothetical protein
VRIAGPDRPVPAKPLRVQRRVSGRGVTQVAGQRLPVGFSHSWTALATGDKAAGTDVIRSMAERAGVTTTEAEGSHVIMLSQPEIVANVIMAAADAVRQPAVTAAR